MGGRMGMADADVFVVGTETPEGYHPRIDTHQGLGESVSTSIGRGVTISEKEIGPGTQ